MFPPIGITQKNTRFFTVTLWIPQIWRSRFQPQMQVTYGSKRDHFEGLAEVLDDFVGFATRRDAKGRSSKKCSPNDNSIHSDLP